MDTNSNQASEARLIDHSTRLNGIVNYCEEAYMTQNKEGVIALTKDYTSGGIVKISEGILSAMGEVDNSVFDLMKNLNELQISLDSIHNDMHLTASEVSAKNGFFDKGDLAPDPIQRKVTQLEGDDLPMPSRQYPPFDFQMNFSKIPSRTYSRMKPQHRRSTSTGHQDQPRKLTETQTNDALGSKSSSSPSIAQKDSN